MKRREFLLAAAGALAFPGRSVAKRPPAPPGRNKTTTPSIAAGYGAAAYGTATYSS